MALNHDLKEIDRRTAQGETRLPFYPANYIQVWRNYARTFKTSLLVYEHHGRAQPTPLANALASEGEITADEYFHFIARSFTDPFPVFREWSSNSIPRYPLAFALKYGLAKLAHLDVRDCELSEILDAYQSSGFVGSEDYESFARLVERQSAATMVFFPSNSSSARQARESLKVMSQISYLHYDGRSLDFSLDGSDARHLLERLQPIERRSNESANEALRSISSNFPKFANSLEVELVHTTTNETRIAGFQEGSKVKRAHMRIERNSKLRAAFFNRFDISECNACGLDTEEKYPFAGRILDLHHLLPLASGSRVQTAGTSLSEVVAVCPTCHRAVHTYYDIWLREHRKLDFEDLQEASGVYAQAKAEIRSRRADA